MSQRNFTHGAVLVAILAAIAAVPAMAGFDVQEKIDADRLIVRNLIGEIEVEGHSGRSFEVEVRVQGRDADRELITVDLERGSIATLSSGFSRSPRCTCATPRTRPNTASKSNCRSCSTSSVTFSWVLCRLAMPKPSRSTKSSKRSGVGRRHRSW